MFYQQRDVICFEDAFDPVLSLFMRNLGLVVKRRGLFSTLVFILFHVVDVRQTSNLLPPTNCLKNCHVLVVGVIPCPETGDDVFEGVKPLSLALMESKERFKKFGVGFK